MASLGVSFNRVDECVHWYARRSPATQALVQDGERLSYRDVSQLVERYAAGLVASGVRRGDRVAVLGYSRSECLLALLGVVSIGATYVGLNPKHSDRELLYVMEDVEPSIVFDMLADGPSLEGRLGRMGYASSPRVLYRLPQRGPVGSSLDEFLQAVNGTDEALIAARACVEPTDTAVIIHTSGSTGFPKGAMLSHRALCANTPILARKAAGRGVAQRTLCDYPINHVSFVHETCLGSLFLGGTVVFRERFDPGETLRLIERERLNVWWGAPMMLAACAETLEFASCDLTSVARIVCAGGTITPELIMRLRERTGAVVRTGWGMSETVGLGTMTDDAADPETVATTVGHPDPELELRIVSAASQAASDDTPGEIVVRSAYLFSGYYNRPDATAEVLDDEGFLHTGDLALDRGDGNLRLVGRIKEMYKSGGYNVYPAEVERVLVDQPEVAAVSVVGIPDETWGEVGVAFIVPAPGSRLTPEWLRDCCTAELANYKIPKRFVFAEELPTLSNGKVDRLTLRRQAAADT
jgi:fatty-acyl-CoA synthase